MACLATDSKKELPWKGPGRTVLSTCETWDTPADVRPFAAENRVNHQTDRVKSWVVGKSTC